MPKAALDRICWDACVFTSWLNDEPDRTPHIEAFLQDAKNNEIEIITSDMSVVEVAFGLTEQQGKQLDPLIEEQIDGLWAADSPIGVVEMHHGIALDARQLIRTVAAKGQGLQGADAIHLATAIRMNATVFHTYDEKLLKKSAAGLLPIKVERPEHAVLALDFDGKGANAAP